MTARDPVVMRERSELPRCRSLRCTACAASRVLCLSAALALALAAAGTAQAQSSGGAYTMNPQSIDAGGGRATGGVFALEGTLGQHDAGNLQSGGVFELIAGFHNRSAAALVELIFSNGFEAP